MDINIEKLAFNFLVTGKINKNSDFYCKTRDIFQARLEKMIFLLLLNSNFKEDDVYLMSAMVGEIGNNSFDHNVGSWFGEIGIFFAYIVDNKKLKVYLVDSGQGIYNTLKKVKPEIKDDREALRVAFNEKISGRAPELRGNGLKFVKANIKKRGMNLKFFSGKAKIELNKVEKIVSLNKKYQGCLAILSL